MRSSANNEEAQQGARANDHGCHDPCSEQHGSRQPWSWLILNVRQSKMRHSTSIVVGTLLVSVYAGSLVCALRSEGKRSRLFFGIAVFLPTAALVSLGYVFWLLRDGWTIPRDTHGNYIRSEGITAVLKASDSALEYPPVLLLCALIAIPVVLYLWKTHARKEKTPNQAPEPTAPSGRGSS